MACGCSGGGMSKAVRIAVAPRKVAPANNVQAPNNINPNGTLNLSGNLTDSDQKRVRRLRERAALRSKLALG